MMIVLSGAICLSATIAALGEVIQYNSPGDYQEATGKKIESFNEAPELKTMVAAGELPPVEKRLPEEPIVIKPLEEIGQYGGTIQILVPSAIAGSTLGYDS